MRICDRCLISIEEYTLSKRSGMNSSSLILRVKQCNSCTRETVSELSPVEISPTSAAPNESQTAKRDATVTEAGLQDEDGGTGVPEAGCQSRDAGT
jgi:hypothetical protein